MSGPANGGRSISSPQRLITSTAIFPVSGESNGNERVAYSLTTLDRSSAGLLPGLPLLFRPSDIRPLTLSEHPLYMKRSARISATSEGAR